MKKGGPAKRASCPHAPPVLTTQTTPDTTQAWLALPLRPRATSQASRYYSGPVLPLRPWPTPLISRATTEASRYYSGPAPPLTLRAEGGPEGHSPPHSDPALPLAPALSWEGGLRGSAPHTHTSRCAVLKGGPAGRQRASSPHGPSQRGGLDRVALGWALGCPDHPSYTARITHSQSGVGWVVFLCL